MKKFIILAFTVILTLSLCACGGNNQTAGQNENTSATSSEVQPETSVPDTENDDNEAADNSAGETTPITLTIGDTVLNGYLNDSDPAKSLIAMLPLTVTLNDSDNDFCGDNLDIEYSENDVQSGYKNGDLTFWPPASNFVIFVDDEENSANTENLVILGKITEPQAALDALEGTIDVTIALAGEMDTLVSEGTENSEEIETESETEVSEVKIKITVGDRSLFATLEDNATTQAIIEQMPMTLPMMDLYGREMCYRYGAYALPTDNLQSDGYEVGDIAYWAPGGSLVILYKQNGEQFERQHLGHIDSGVEVFENIGDVDVTFEVVDEP